MKKVTGQQLCSEKSSDLFMKKNFIFRAAGCILVILAVVLTGLKAEIWKFGIDTESMWTLIIAVPFLLWMLAFGVNIFNSLGFYAGVGLMIYHKGFISSENIPFLILIMALCAAGTFCSGISYKFIKPDILKQTDLSRTSPKVSAVGCMKNILNRFDGIIGGDLRVFSGSMIYDMSDSSIDTGTVINTTVRFGDLYLIVPDDVMIQSEVKGNFINSQAAPKTYSSVITVGGTVKFGKLYIFGKSDTEIK